MSSILPTGKEPSSLESTLPSSITTPDIPFPEKQPSSSITLIGRIRQLAKDFSDWSGLTTLLEKIRSVVNKYLYTKSSKLSTDDGFVFVRTYEQPPQGLNDVVKEIHVLGEDPLETVKSGVKEALQKAQQRSQQEKIDEMAKDLHSILAEHKENIFIKAAKDLPQEIDDFKERFKQELAQEPEYVKKLNSVQKLADSFSKTAKELQKLEDAIPTLKKGDIAEHKAKLESAILSYNSQLDRLKQTIPNFFTTPENLSKKVFVEYDMKTAEKENFEDIYKSLTS